MGPGDANGIELRTVTFHASADRFGHEILDLFMADAHVRQPLTGQQQLGGQGIGFLLPALSEAAAALAMAQHRIGDFHPLFSAHQLIG